jgi:beta-galactosidase
MAGQFLWVGFDYLGENSWPATTYDQGLFDRAGNWKPRGLQRRSWWSTKPVVHIVRREDNAGTGDWIANWTPADLNTYDDAKVQVYSNAEQVELFLNGESLGSKAKPKDDSPRGWDVTFAPGTLRAVASNGGKEVAVEELKTAGPAARIELASSRSTLGAGWNDAAFVTARIVDANGVQVPNGSVPLTFSVGGPGALAGVDNGNVTSHDAYQSNLCKTDRGQCVAVVKASAAAGTITFKAEAKGLAGASLAIPTAAGAQ